MELQSNKCHLFQIRGLAPPAARSSLHITTIPSPEPPRSTFVWVTEVLRGCSGAAPKTVWCPVGAALPVEGEKARLVRAPSCDRMGRRDAENGQTARAGAPSRA